MCHTASIGLVVQGLHCLKVRRARARARALVVAGHGERDENCYFLKTTRSIPPPSGSYRALQQGVRECSPGNLGKGKDTDQSARPVNPEQEVKVIMGVFGRLCCPTALDGKSMNMIV
jgi:hypothetical protein